MENLEQKNPIGAYKRLCSLFYELDKPHAPPASLATYLDYIAAAKGPILEPMCGTGRYIIPIAQKGYAITGFDSSAEMLRICQQKCEKLNLKCEVLQATLENFKHDALFDFIFIPEGSFSLLTTPASVKNALQTVYSHLTPGGKFVLEVETMATLVNQSDALTAKWVVTPEGDKLVNLSVGRQFDPRTRVQTSLGKYEWWKRDGIAQTELEEFRLRLYTPAEIETLLAAQGWRIRERVPTYPAGASLEEAVTLLYVCTKL